MTVKLKAGPDDAGRRLDRILRKSLPDCSLSLIHRLLRQGKVLVNHKKAKPDERIQPGVIIEIQLESIVTYRSEQVNKVNAVSGNDAVNQDFSDVNKNTAPPATPLPEILWWGAGIIVFNKPTGVVSHGKNSLDTLVNSWLDGTLPSSLSFKPGPLHRLDKPTSGAITFSETLEGAQWFSNLLRERKVIKTYLAIVEGRIKKDEVWQDGLIRDKTIRKTLVNSKKKTVNPDQKPQQAVTMVKALASNGPYTLIEARIVTGRTHQIRAQAAAHGHPLAGDIKYGGKKLPAAGGFFLHAWKMELGEPPEGFPQPLIAPLPDSFQSQIETLFQIREWGAGSR